MLTIQERRQLRTFGWANGFMNVGFVAGRMRRDPKNPRLIHIQQTPAVEQSIPVMLDKGYILSETGFPDGTYVSIMGRVRGFNTEQKNAAMVEALHVGYMNASEVDVDVHMNRLYGMLRTLPGDVQKSAEESGLKSADVQQPSELQAFDGVRRGEDAESAADDGGIRNRKEAMLRNANRVQIAGIVGYMEFREGSPDGGKSQSARLQIWLQQNANLDDAIPVRIYGRLATEAVQRLRIGLATYVDGNILVDVKRTDELLEGGGHVLDKTPYVKAYSHDMAQQMHVRVAHDWAVELYELGKDNQKTADRLRFIRYEPKDSAPRKE